MSGRTAWLATRFRTSEIAVRQIVLDTETTGLEIAEGHRIVEIGCVTLVDRQLREEWHRYLNPDREIDQAAVAITGITVDQLEDSPRFAAVADDLLEHLEGAELVIHNAEFDVGFLDRELALMGHDKRIADVAAGVVDTLDLARKMHPGLRNSLDALCKRYDVDNAVRKHHGALLDARLLADVYLRMTGGQISMSLDVVALPSHSGDGPSELGLRRVPVVRAAAEELAAHRRRVAGICAIAGHCLFEE